MADSTEDVMPEEDHFEVSAPKVKLRKAPSPEQRLAEQAMDDLARDMSKTIHCYDDNIRCAEECKQEVDRAVGDYIAQYNVDGSTFNIEEFYNRCRLYSADEVEGKPAKRSNKKASKKKVSKKVSKKKSSKKKVSKKTAGSRKRLSPLDKAKAVKRVVTGNMLGRELDRAVAKELKISSDKINQQWYIVRIAGLEDFSLKVTSATKKHKQQKYIDKAKTVAACQKAISKLSS